MFLFLVMADLADPVSYVDETIIITGFREPAPVKTTPVSATIFDRQQMEALALTAPGDILRFSPGASVASGGPKGTQTQIRIRGAEANHTLLFVDGIKFNDPAAGNEARFELMANDALSRIEIVRGPQSALWGAEALGGVVAIETANPLTGRGVSAASEYGSHDSRRASVQFAARTGKLGLSGSAGWMQSDGINSFGGNGERDGYTNHAASLKAVFTPSPSSEIGLVGHWIEAASDFDGFNPATYLRADTLDNTKNRIRALRGWGKVAGNGWTVQIDTSILGSHNHNRLGDAGLNTTYGQRLTLGGQIAKQIGNNRLIAAITQENEDFQARDQLYSGLTNQDRSRNFTAFTGEWRAAWSETFTTDFVIRHDSFSAFDNATTMRASALFKPAEKWTIHAAYGEGIAQPGFYDLFGFFPGSFVGNSSLKSEKSKGWEIGLRFHTNNAELDITGYRNRLHNEIVDTYNPATYLSSTANVEGKSRRAGIEIDARYRFSPVAQLYLTYSWLDADEQKTASAVMIREIRRPKHSASALWLGSSGSFNWAAGFSYTGKRWDTDFDAYPALRLKLDDYVLGSLKIGYRITPAIEAYARIENAFGAQYQDVIGYHTAGRTLYAGLRLRLGD